MTDLLCNKCVNYLTINDRYYGCTESKKDKILQPINGDCPHFKGNSYSIPILKFVTTSTVEKVGEVSCREMKNMKHIDGYVIRINIEELKQNMSLDPRVIDYKFYETGD